LAVLVDHEAEHHQVFLLGLLLHLKDLGPLHVTGIEAHDFFRQVQGLHYGMHLRKQGVEHGVVPVGRKEAPRRLEVADLEHKAAPAMRGQQGIQKLGGSVRQSKKELPLRVVEFWGLVKRAAPGRIKQRNGPGHT